MVGFSFGFKCGPAWEQAMTCQGGRMSTLNEALVYKRSCLVDNLFLHPLSAKNHFTQFCQSSLLATCTYAHMSSPWAAYSVVLSSP